MSNHFLNFLQFLLVACVTAALVGGVALSAAIGSNVLERTREIGVLRTLGATTGTTFRLVLGQSLSLTLLCLALAIAGSFPLGVWSRPTRAHRAANICVTCRFKAGDRCTDGCLLGARAARLYCARNPDWRHADPDRDCL